MAAVLPPIAPASVNPNRGLFFRRSGYPQEDHRVSPARKASVTDIPSQACTLTTVYDHQTMFLNKTVPSLCCTFIKTRPSPDRTFTKTVPAPRPYLQHGVLSSRQYPHQHYCTFIKAVPTGTFFHVDCTIPRLPLHQDRIPPLERTDTKTLTLAKNVPLPTLYPHQD